MLQPFLCMGDARPQKGRRDPAEKGQLLELKSGVGGCFATTQRCHSGSCCHHTERTKAQAGCVTAEFIIAQGKISFVFARERTHTCVCVCVCAFPIGVFAQPKVHRAAPPEEAARLEEVKRILALGRGACWVVRQKKADPEKHAAG